MCRPARRNMSFTHSHRGISAIGAVAGRSSLLGRSDALDVLSAGRPLSVAKKGFIFFVVHGVTVEVTQMLGARPCVPICRCLGPTPRTHPQRSGSTFSDDVSRRGRSYRLCLAKPPAVVVDYQFRKIGEYISSF